MMSGLSISNGFVSTQYVSISAIQCKESKLKAEAFTDNKPVEQSIRSTKQVHENRLRVELGEVQRLLEEGGGGGGVQDVK